MVTKICSLSWTGEEMNFNCTTFRQLGAKLFYKCRCVLLLLGDCGAIATVWLTGRRSLDCQVSGQCDWRVAARWTVRSEVSVIDVCRSLDCQVSVQCDWRVAARWTVRSEVSVIDGCRSLDCQVSVQCDWRVAARWTVRSEVSVIDGCRSLDCQVSGQCDWRVADRWTVRSEVNVHLATVNSTHCSHGSAHRTCLFTGYIVLLKCQLSFCFDYIFDKWWHI